jgi:hypothetical protein
MRTPKDKYRDHKRGATARGINFLLTFDEWWNIWQQSGYWDKRGCKKGQYCMSRIGDIGPYIVGNVFIQTHRQNILDCQNRNKFKTGPQDPIVILKKADSKAEDWEFIDPQGNKHIVHNAAKFCNLHNLGKGAMCEVASGIRRHHKKWTCKKI